jgi:hypothetical protein
LPFGKDGSEAGNAINKATVKCIRYLIVEEAIRKVASGESNSFRITNKIIDLAPLFKRYLGVNVTEKGVM